ncbi:MAG: CRISPR-associated endonuclease Cas2 [Desulfuromusa sp.]|nr:CRISPR-associated endonuclease Cas2 [Desulfuromusa sp.]
MNMLITYDIANGRRLQRVAKVMLDYGLRVQRSIFEADVSLAQFRELRDRTEAEMDFLEDGVKYFPLCKQCDYLWYVVGENLVVEDRGFLVL